MAQALKPLPDVAQQRPHDVAQQRPDDAVQQRPDDAVQQRVALGVASLAAEANRASVGFARAVSHAVACGYWRAAVLQAGGGENAFAPAAWDEDDLDGGSARRFGAFGADLAPLGVETAMAEIGRIYTNLLPLAHRRQNGIYYTPHALTVRLVDDATRAGMDWRHGKAISPACGAGAFLVEDARRMVAAMRDADPAIVVASIGARLRGWDRDPFACWMAQLAVEAVLLPQMVACGRRLPSIIACRDSLIAELGAHGGAYDLANENPPFGKIKDSAALRARYRRSLRGHPNAYGMFADLCIDLVKPEGGIVALLSPTSWLAGDYFAALRTTLAALARPVSVALVAGRRGAFDDVLQELSLSCFVRGRTQDRAECSAIHVAQGHVRRESTGFLVLPEDARAPWSMPRRAEDAALVAIMRAMTFRLRDYGYGVSTGPMVWNRAARLGRLHESKGPGRVPICWSEAVSQDGVFRGLRPRKPGHAPFYEMRPDGDPNVITTACILAQRTTAKEQRRRLVTAILPQPAIDAAGGKVAVENHLNMILPLSGSPRVAIDTLAAFLATDTADAVLRCINASVAVSASELEALPLPAPDDLGRAMASDDPALAIRRLYGISNGNGKARDRGFGF